MNIVKGDLAVSNGTLNAGQFHPFTLTGTIAPVGVTYTQSDWPHFFISLYLSKDNILDENDYRIPYELTSCQVYALSGMFSGGSTEALTLDDMRKFPKMLIFLKTALTAKSQAIENYMQALYQ